MMTQKIGQITVLVAALCLLFATFPITAQATDYYVDAVNGDNGNSGLAPGAGNAWQTITYALSQVSGTHTINVAAGTYDTALGETFPLNMKNSVSLQGAGAATTIIDANDTARVIQASSIASPTTLDGFTLTNGSSSGYVGAGINSDGCTWTVSNCIITGNQNAGGAGGGLYCEVYDYTTYTNCSFTYNSAGGGGAIYIYYRSAPTFNNCVISNNSASSGGAFFAESIGTTYGFPTFINCTITDNSATSKGGAMYGYSGPGLFYNCTIAGNSAPSGSALSGMNTGATVLINTILWGNTGATYEIQRASTSWSFSIAEISYSDWNPSNKEPQVVITSESNTINLDPLFVGGGDYHLQGTEPNVSPCIDAGTDDDVTYPDIPSDDRDGDSRPQGSGYDIGSDEYAAAGPTCVDNDGDGYGVCPDCDIVNGCTYDGHDCNDGDDTIYPGATEVPCDGIDQDCDGSDFCCVDNDLDGYGVCPDCDIANGCTYDGHDCNDGEDTIYPGATEVLCDGIDQDCDGSDSCEIIIDNADPEATFVGSWPSYSGYAQIYGANARYHLAGAGSDTATWTPDVPVANAYSVYAWWHAHTNRSTSATYTINHSSGSDQVAVNQQINGGQWNLLGVYTFDAGISGSVVLTQSADGIVSADAIKLDLVGQTYDISGQITESAVGLDGITVELTGYMTDSTVTAGGGYYTFSVPDGQSYTVTPTSGAYDFTPTYRDVAVSGADVTGQDFTADVASAIEFIVDNDDLEATYSGYWPSYSGYAELYDNDGRYHVAGSGSDTATWTPNVPMANTYSVYAWWHAHTNRSTSATYTINHSSGSDQVAVNQQINGGQWNLLGIYTFDAGISGSVVLTQSGDGIVSADAIRWESVGDTQNISGQITESAVGLDGITVELTGFMTGSTVTSGGGYYTFTVPDNQSYTVTPSSGLYDFTPTFIDVAVSGTDVTGQDFTADVASTVEFIVDNANPEATFVGSWPSYSGYAQIYGANARYHLAGAGSDTATWTPDVPVANTYSVYAWWHAHTNRSTSATYTINHSSGSDQVAVNQQINGGQWNLLGVYTFDAGISGSVVLTQSADGIVSADAIRWQSAGNVQNISGQITESAVGLDGITVELTGYITASAATSGGGYYTFAVPDNQSYTVTPSSGLYDFTPTYRDVAVSGTDVTGQDFTADVSATAEVIVDNADAGATFVGTWPVYSGYAQLYDGDARYHFAGAGSHTATWTPDLPVADTYDVYAWWHAHTNRSTSAPYTIYYDGGSETVYANQQILGGQWNLLGTYPFAAGTSGSAVLTQNADGIVSADAIRWQRQ